MLCLLEGQSMQSLANISVTILTRNSHRHLRRVLEALAEFDEVLVYDTGSTDQTLSIAANFPNVTLREGPFIGFGPSHNKATAEARNDWILSIDSDEVVTPELRKELASLSLSKKSVYAPWRKNFYRGKWIRWCGWYPDYQVKLYNRTVTRFSDAQVHEAVQTEQLDIQKLHSPVEHYPYSCTEDFLHKMQSYSTLFAEQSTKQSSLGKAITRGLFTFFKSYLLKRGIFGGREGFEISVYNANTAFYKYLKLAEKQKNTIDSNR